MTKQGGDLPKRKRAQRIEGHARSSNRGHVAATPAWAHELTKQAEPKAGAVADDHAHPAAVLGDEPALRAGVRAQGGAGMSGGRNVKQVKRIMGKQGWRFVKAPAPDYRYPHGAPGSKCVCPACSKAVKDNELKDRDEWLDP